MTILITGATGNIGGEVIRCLLGKNIAMRALVRDLKKGAKLSQQGVELAQGDFAQPESLNTALQGVEKAFLITSNLPNQVEVECNFINVAKQAGVKHIIKLSVLGAGKLPSTFQKWHREIEIHLEHSGIAWTHLQPNMFMQNIRWFAETIKRDGAFYNCVGDVKISHVDARDVGAVAAVCLTEAGHENVSYVLTGDKAITFYDVADIFTKALGRSVNYVDLPPADLKAARLANGEPEWYLDAELELCANWKQGAGSAVTNTIAEMTGKKATSYEEFTRYYAQSILN